MASFVGGNLFEDDRDIFETLFPGRLCELGVPTLQDLPSPSMAASRFFFVSPAGPAGKPAVISVMPPSKSRMNILAWVFSSFAVSRKAEAAFS